MIIKRSFLIIDLLLVALAVYLGVKCAYSYFESRLDTLPPAEVVPGTASVSEKAEVPPFSSFRAITQRNLFRTVLETEKPSADINLEALNDTQLKLKLWATFASDNPEKSFAIIEDTKSREPKVYKINDALQNATLKMILPDKVVLSVSGKPEPEILALQQRQTSTAAIRSSSSTRVASSTSSASASATTTTTRRMYLPRSQVESAMENLTELMGQIQIQPYSEDGVEGLSLSNIQPNSIFRRMGLRNGDILVAVDGQSLTNVDQALKLYEDLKSSDTANLEINRKKRSIKFQYQIR